MNAQDRYNSERYPDMTCFLALRNIERNERKERRNRMKENWIYRRGDVYLAALLGAYVRVEVGKIHVAPAVVPVFLHAVSPFLSFLSFVIPHCLI